MKNYAWKRWLAAAMLVVGTAMAACSSNTAGPNRRPVAEAGPDVTKDVGKTATLDGSKSYDPDGDKLTYQWSLLAAPTDSTAKLSAERGVTTEVTPDVKGIYLVGLVVSDGKLASEQDVVRVTATTPCKIDKDCEDYNPCTVDKCQNEKCTYTPNDSAQCDDHNACSKDDHCSNGVCLGSTSCDDKNPCTDDSCDPASGCKFTYNDSNACSDANACTSGDHCSGGSCVSGTPVDCDDKNPCTDDSCDATTGCNHANNTGSCSDGKYCTAYDTCSGGLCVGSGDPCPGQKCDEAGKRCVDCLVDTDCNDNRSCTTETCNTTTGTCVHTPDDSKCPVDGLWCNGNESCNPSGAGADATTGCFHSGNPCLATNQVCNEATDTCVGCGADADCNTTCKNCTDATCDLGTHTCNCAPNNSKCPSDNIFCNGTESCNPTAPGSDADGCVHSGDPCTGGAPCNRHCNEGGGGTGNCFDPSSTVCDDANLCTYSDFCNSGTCAGTAITCSSDTCTMRTCNGSSSCTIVYNNGLGCDDQNLCTYSDICNNGTCAGTAITCSSDTCTTRTCNGSSSCTVVYNNGVGCNDQNLCTYGDSCNNGTCAGTTILCSSDTCTTRTCNGSSSCTVVYNNGVGCNDQNLCTYSDICNNGTCAGTAIICSSNTCTTRTCNGSSSCTVVYNNGVGCDDGDACTSGDQCNNGTCAGAAKNCADSDPCTIDSCNPGDGSCVHTPKNCGDGNPCTDDGCDSSGSCTHTAKNCADSDPCTIDSCNPGDGSCVHTPKNCADTDPCTDDSCDGASGNCIHAFNTAPCDDYIACTTNDRCDGADHCLGTPNDSQCNSPDLCRPSCTTNNSGCVTPPASLNLTCDATVQLPSNVANCSISLGAQTDQVSCLSCNAEVGTVVVDSTGFTGCAQNGWSLVSAATCARTVAGCTLGNQDQACCATFSSICVSDTLRTDKALNCGGGVEEWRLQKTFNLTNLSNVKVCFAISDNNSDANQGILVYASDPAPHNQQIFCLNGEPRPGVDNQWNNYCVDLPAWANNNANVTIMFLAHSENNNRQLFLDNITVTGWNPNCAQPLFSDNFDGCTGGSNLVGNYNGWGGAGTVYCPGGGLFNCFDTSKRARAWNSTGTLERRVNTTGYTGVTVCFFLGDWGSSGSDGLTVSFDTSGTGSNWQQAFTQTGDLGVDQTCRQICANLSAINAAADNNANLGIRFNMVSGGNRTVDVDNVTVIGSHFCSVVGSVTLSSITDNGNGTYSFTGTDVSSVQLGTQFECIWDNPSLNILDTSYTWFKP